MASLLTPRFATRAGLERGYAVVAVVADADDDDDDDDGVDDDEHDEATSK